MSRFELQVLGEAKSRDDVAAMLEAIARDIRLGDDSGERPGTDKSYGDWTLSVIGDDLD